MSSAECGARCAGRSIQPNGYHVMVARTQTIVQLTDDLVAALDAEATRRGVSRSALIREAVAAFLVENGDDAATRAIVAGYLRAPPGTPDEWGRLDAQGERATVELLHRLDAEEQAAGFDEW